MSQLVGNACGTIAAIHTMANSVDEIEFDKEKGLVKFMEKSKDMTPDDRGKLLGEDDGIADSSETVAKTGQTKAPVAEDKTNFHFITFVMVEDHLYELDGGKSYPINHGKTTREKFLKDAANVIQKNFMDLQPKELRFSMITLGPAPVDEEVVADEDATKEK
eukprot:TRINITY_DN13158_c0_g1_i2.p1 TRINITY_DN13158_c0_g1~~TRINITY_DN13158_c0_g1_i2.p1  ORF type:complete len:186 (+),score=53.43 TRINITY_DN13158_c0_g1_i2:73-558(+)